MAYEFSADFSPLATLPRIRRDAVMQANRERTLAELGQMGPGADYNEMARRVMPVDPQLGMTLASLGNSQQNNQRDFQLREKTHADTVAHQNRTFALQERTANEANRGFETREVDDGQGGKILVRLNRQTGQAERVPISGQDQTPQNPFASGKMNESQSKDALYASRMLASENVFRTAIPGPDGKPTDRRIENMGEDYVERRKQWVTDKTGYNVNSPDYQKFDQARRDFINATLRRESGAVISDSEFDNANKQYFPRPGDTSQLVEQKRKNRAEAIRGIGSGAGQGYRPDFVFAANGDLVPNPSAQRNALPPVTAQPNPAQPKPGLNEKTVAAARADPAATLAEARAAIQAHPDKKDAIVRRLQQAGINPAGL